jgi:hypothetical protein
MLTRLNLKANIMQNLWPRLRIPGRQLVNGEVAAGRPVRWGHAIYSWFRFLFDASVLFYTFQTSGDREYFITFGEDTNLLPTDWSEQA